MIGKQVLPVWLAMSDTHPTAWGQGQSEGYPSSEWPKLPE